MVSYKDFNSFYERESDIGRSKKLLEIKKERKKQAEIKQINEYESEKRKQAYSNLPIVKASRSTADILVSRNPTEKKLAQPKFIPQGVNISREQDLLQGMFGGHKNQVIFSGEGDSLPKFNGALTSGSGLINNQDYGRTGRFFGVRR